MTALDLFDITGPADHVRTGPLAASRIAVRFAVETPPLETLVPTLQAVIAEKLLSGELLVDVASYAHVSDRGEGPGLVLAGAFAHYGITAGVRPTLYRAQKRPWDLSPLERIRQSVRRTRQLAGILAARHEGFRIVEGTVEIGILDRLRAPNTARTFELVAPILASSLGAEAVTHVDRPGEPFAVRIRYSAGASPSATRVSSSSSGSVSP
jgi:hypothetical protein